MCLSCHLGNIEEGRFISHAMFAAGHPPLPSFELQTFIDQLPPHWVPLEKKTPPQQKLLHYTSEPMPRSHRVEVGNLEARRASATLIEQESRRVGVHGRPDWGVYDCFACHHELHRPSPRQIAGYDGRRSGSLPPPDWMIRGFELSRGPLEKQQVCAAVVDLCGEKPGATPDFPSRAEKSIGRQA